MGMCGEKGDARLQEYTKGMNGGRGGTKKCTHRQRGRQMGIDRETWEGGGIKMRKK